MTDAAVIPFVDFNGPAAREQDLDVGIFRTLMIRKTLGNPRALVKGYFRDVKPGVKKC